MACQPAHHTMPQHHAMLRTPMRPQGTPLSIDLRIRSNPHGIVSGTLEYPTTLDCRFLARPLDIDNRCHGSPPNVALRWLDNPFRCDMGIVNPSTPCPGTPQVPYIPNPIVLLPVVHAAITVACWV